MEPLRKNISSANITTSDIIEKLTLWSNSVGKIAEKKMLAERMHWYEDEQ